MIGRELSAEFDFFGAKCVRSRKSVPVYARAVGGCNAAPRRQVFRRAKRPHLAKLGPQERGR
jgi:hypothetical protein